MYRLTLIFLACLLLPFGVVSAQEGDDLQCGETDIFAAIDDALVRLEDAKSQDASAAFASVDEVRQALAKLNSHCQGLTFTGTDGTLHGPVTVPQGIYRITVNWQRAFTMSSMVLEGECSHGRHDDIFIFNEGLGAGMEERSTEKVFVSEGCAVLFETSNIAGPYTVTFEKLD